MGNLYEIFKIPNTKENYEKRESIIDQYRASQGFDSFKGVNIAEVIKWAEKKFK